MSDFFAYQWVRDHVQHRLESMVKELGKLVGDREKAQREAMVAHVEREVGSLRGTVEAQRKFIEEQRRTIDTLTRRLEGVEGMFGTPGKTVDGVARRLS